MSKPLVPHKFCHLGSKVLNTVPDVVPFFATGTVSVEYRVPFRIPRLYYKNYMPNYKLKLHLYNPTHLMLNI